MEYISDININEAVINVLDVAAGEPVLNEYKLDLDEDTYKFLYKHLEKCFKDENLKYAAFNFERNIVKEVVQNYLNGTDSDLIELSKELSRQLFVMMKSNYLIPSADLITCSITTDQGPMIAILKLDYVKNFTHEVQFVDNKIGIGIIPQSAGLPGSGQKIQKAAFIKPIRTYDRYNLFILDNQKTTKEVEEYESNYFINNFLGATLVTNERDMTKALVQATEIWTRKNITEDAGEAEKIRTTIKTKLKEEDSINVKELAEELLSNSPQAKEDFTNYLNQQGLEDITVDSAWVDKKFKRIRLNVDKEIDLYINEEAYHDPSKFEIVRNGDGTINMVVKNVRNYIEK